MCLKEGFSKYGHIYETSMMYPMFLFWVASSFVCDHAGFRAPFREVWLKPV